MFSLREKLLKAAFAELWAGIAIMVIAGFVCLPWTGAAGFGCLMAGVVAGVLLSPIFAKLLYKGMEGSIHKLQSENSQLKRDSDVLEKQFREQTEELGNANQRLAAVEVENRSLKNSAIQISDLTPILKLMLLRWEGTVWDPRDTFIEEDRYYRALRIVELKANLGIDLERLKWIDTPDNIEVFGFKKVQLFDGLGDWKWLHKGIWEKNKFLAGDWTVKVKDVDLDRFAEKHDCELRKRIDESRVTDLAQFDDRLKDAVRSIIRLCFKGTPKQIIFRSEDPPENALALSEHLTGHRALR